MPHNTHGTTYPALLKPPKPLLPPHAPPYPPPDTMVRHVCGPQHQHLLPRTPKTISPPPPSIQTQWHVAYVDPNTNISYPAHLKPHPPPPLQTQWSGAYVDPNTNISYPGWFSAPGALYGNMALCEIFPRAEFPVLPGSNSSGNSSSGSYSNASFYAQVGNGGEARVTGGRGEAGEGGGGR